MQWDRYAPEQREADDPRFTRDEADCQVLEDNSRRGNILGEIHALADHQYQMHVQGMRGDGCLARGLEALHPYFPYRMRMSGF